MTERFIVVKIHQGYAHAYGPYQDFLLANARRLRIMASSPKGTKVFVAPMDGDGVQR